MKFIMRIFCRWFCSLSVSKDNSPDLIAFKKPNMFLAKGKYKEGKKHGEFRTYNKFGKLVLIEWYDQGIPYLTKHYEVSR